MLHGAPVGQRQEAAGRVFFISAPFDCRSGKPLAQRIANSFAHGNPAHQRLGEFKLAVLLHRQIAFDLFAGPQNSQLIQPIDVSHRPGDMPVVDAVSVQQIRRPHFVDAGALHAHE